MRILVLNSGSSTLKLDLLDITSGAAPPVQIAQGLVDRIGTTSATLTLDVGDQHIEQPSGMSGYTHALTQSLDALQSLTSAPTDAVGHRVVHGGDRYTTPTPLTTDILASLDSLSELAPLHNPPALEVIRAARAILGPHIPMVAIFDTAFHSTLPELAHTYALPHDLASRHNIRRYGFHGIAHQYMLDRYCAITSTPCDEATIITLQLGNGCSACAIRDGRSIDTSMGFTPLEGLVMGTRSGDLDPGIISFLAGKENVLADEVVTWLNKRSGLLGISNSTSDMRTLLASRTKDPHAELAIEIFCYRIRKYIGAYMSALGGTRAVIFGGGIGENAPSIRARILDNMAWCGLQLDPSRNDQATGDEALISADASRLAVYVVPVEESHLIARQTYDCLTTTSHQAT